MNHFRPFIAVTKSIVQTKTNAMAKHGGLHFIFGKLLFFFFFMGPQQRSVPIFHSLTVSNFHWPVGWLLFIYLFIFPFFHFFLRVLLTFSFPYSPRSLHKLKNNTNSNGPTRPVRDK